MTHELNVHVRVKNNVGRLPTTLVIPAKPTDLVKDIKMKVANSQLIAFPESNLVLDDSTSEGCTMDETKTLHDSGVTDESEVDFIVHADEAVLLKQLKELLKARALTFDEVGLLYAYKYGVNVNTSLQSVGRDMKLGEFLGLHSDFCVREGKVSVAGQPAAGQPAAAPPGLA